MLLFAKGLAVGLAIAAPVGPVGVLCIRRTLHEGALTGLVTGLGAACADALYGAVAGFGLTAVSSALFQVQQELRLAGGAFLVILGLRILIVPRGSDSGSAPAPRRVRLAGAFGSCFMLTLTNPATILSFVAVFAGLGLVEQAGDYAGALSLVAGVFLGSAFWWVALSGSVGLLRAKMSMDLMRRVNLASGTILVGFGLVALGAAVL